jgi:hypothetical protein
MPLPKYQEKDLIVAIGKIKIYHKKSCSMFYKEMHLKTQQLDLKVGDTSSLVERYVYCVAKTGKNEIFAYYLFRKMQKSKQCDIEFVISPIQNI